MHPHGAPDPIVKKSKPIIVRGTVLEGWLDRPCKIHTTPDTIPTHNLRACWILRQVAKNGEDILTKNTPEQHPPEDDDLSVLTVFETFASNNRRKRAFRDLAKVCHIAAINPWNDTAITFNASEELNSEQSEYQPLWSLVQLWMASGLPKCSWTAAAD